MFYAHFVLAKKGPLSRIWLAAHWDKKLTKAHVFETNIEQSVDGILQPKVKMALRTSGHLLLGVVRIYSRKAKYLLADCNEAFVKIKMAFRPGMVDLPEDNREAAMNAITLPEVFHDFDTEMPDLNDVDIQAQFSMNQTRAEEITMREDYGNINLETEDNGFGDGANAPGTPEMLREHEDFGGENISLAPPESTRDFSVVGDYNSITGDSVAPSSTMFKHGAPGFREEHLTVTGSVAGGTDVMTANIFEEGSLFEDVPPTMSPERDVGPLTESLVQDFPSVRSPASSVGDGYRPPTPMDDHMSPPASPTPSQHSLAPSVAPSMRSIAPSEAAPPPGSQSVRSTAESEVETPQTTSQTEEESSVENTTTLIHNEAESFALAPVDASTLKGFTKAKRKRKLVVDEVKAITGEEMKAQLSDTSDIVTTLDLAPPTKRLMHWKETGGVEKLFALPSRTLYSNMIFNRYTKSLSVRPGGDERFDNLPALEDDPSFAYAEERDEPEFQAPLPPKRENRGRKRKQTQEFTEHQTEYMRYQEELIRATEESAREERERQKRSKEDKAASTPQRQDEEQSETEEQSEEEPPTPAAPEEEPPTPAAPEESRLNSATPPHSSPARSEEAPGSPGGRDDYPPPQEEEEAEAFPHEDSQRLGGRSTHESVADHPPSHHSPTPADYPTSHRPPSSSHHASSAHGGEGGGGSNRGGHYPPQESASSPLREDEDEPSSFPVPPRASLNQSEYTDQWVSQAATETATGTAIPPPQTPMHNEWGDDGDDYVDDVGGEELEGDEEMGEDETIESFEDRVLNKRAAQLHRNLARRYENEQGGPLQLSGLLRRSDKKGAATKFYSCLVLSKVNAVMIEQKEMFGELILHKSEQFENAASSL